MNEMDAITWRIEKMRVYLPPVDEARLKYFAVFIMLIDHVTYAFLERACGKDGILLMHALPRGELLARIGRAVGRQAFPIFCFFLVEGFFYTRSRIRHLVLLAVFAALSQVPFQKCLFPRSAVLHANVLCTLGIGYLMIWAIETLRTRCLCQGQPYLQIIFFLLSLGIAGGASFIAYRLHSDYRHGGVILILLLYLFRDYRLTALFVSWAWLSWYNKLELYAAPAFFLLACYNGKRGRQHKLFFYFFYPAHLLVLWLVRRHFFGF